jgi:hypothetical protein
VIGDPVPSSNSAAASMSLAGDLFGVDAPDPCRPEYIAPSEYRCRSALGVELGEFLHCAMRSPPKMPCGLAIRQSMRDGLERIFLVLLGQQK